MKPCNITSTHVGHCLLHGSLRVIQIQFRSKVCNILYLRVLFHSSKLLLTFWYKKNAFMLQVFENVILFGNLHSCTNLGGSSLVNALCGSTDEALGIIGTTQRYRSR